MWNPDVYLAFADHRGRPFFDLLSRVGADKPRRVVDLGCGPGNLTSPSRSAGRTPSSRRGTAHRRWWMRPANAVSTLM
jgi:trans-aconitate methyltransferase